MVPFAVDASGDGLWEAERECISTPPPSIFFCFLCFLFGFLGGFFVLFFAGFFCFCFFVFCFFVFANEIFSIANLLGDPGEEAR